MSNKDNLQLLRANDQSHSVSLYIAYTIGRFLNVFKID